MRDVSDLMLRFKEATRHTWNTVFEDQDDLMSPDVQEAFSMVEKGLFQATVLVPLGMPEKLEEYRSKPLSWLVVKPVDYLSEYPIQFGDAKSPSGTNWQRPASVTASQDDKFGFFDFFDWNPYGFIDAALVRCKVMRLPARPEREGVFALIEHRHCRFFLSESTD